MFTSRRGSSMTSPSGKIDPAGAKKRLLTVELLEARNLIPSSKNGTSDPFVNLVLRSIAGTEIKAETFKSTQKNGTVSPSWNEKFTFGMGIL